MGVLFYFSFLFFLGKKYQLLHFVVIPYRECTEPIWQG